jgi:hypothetical protein
MGVHFGFNDTKQGAPEVAAAEVEGQAVAQVAGHERVDLLPALEEPRHSRQHPAHYPHFHPPLQPALIALGGFAPIVSAGTKCPKCWHIPQTTAGTRRVSHLDDCISVRCGDTGDCLRPVVITKQDQLCVQTTIRGYTSSNGEGKSVTQPKQKRLRL